MVIAGALYHSYCFYGEVFVGRRFFICQQNALRYTYTQNGAANAIDPSKNLGNRHSLLRSEERRVGKECSPRWWACQEKKESDTAYICNVTGRVQRTEMP